VAAAMSALLWDYFFLPPIYAFQITHVEDAMLFGMYFVVALVLGHLTTRIRAQEESERERESRATVLYLLTRDLNESVNLDHMVQRIVEQLETCFKAKVAVLLPDGNGTLKAHTGSTFQIPEAEKPVALWALHHLQRAGKLTKHLPTATGLYVPLVTSSGPLGVLGLSNNQTLGRSLHQENLIDAVSQQIAMALDRHRLNGISEKAKLLAESERLSQTLLDSMSHEIRTPIAAIQSATGNLAELPETDSKMRLQMIAELQEATERLNRLVGNVLEASRLESGTVKPRLNECDVSELIHVVLEESEKDLSTHVVTTAIQPGLPVMPMDFVLMQQALANLVSNAALHTPAGTSIEVGARLDQDSLLLTVADRGPGIPADCLPRIFDKFYRLPNSRTGGTGLGLSLVKGFVEAQGGKVAANNQPGGGVVFTIRLPRQNSGVIPEEAQL
jgi:two-component system sensor histidine kinase KdpD